jgi:hypothetical protein
MNESNVGKAKIPKKQLYVRERIKLFAIRMLQKMSCEDEVRNSE